jgi:hypothetical protein
VLARLVIGFVEAREFEAVKAGIDGIYRAAIDPGAAGDLRRAGVPSRTMPLARLAICFQAPAGSGSDGARAHAHVGPRSAGPSTAAVDPNRRALLDARAADLLSPGRGQLQCRPAPGRQGGAGAGRTRGRRLRPVRRGLRSGALSRQERIDYHDPAVNRAAVTGYVERLLTAEALVLCFPVWNFGLPALLKGFFDRVVLPGVSFDRSADGRIAPRLQHIGKIGAIATY